MVLLAILPLIFLFLVDLMVQASCVEHAYVLNARLRLFFGLLCFFF
jgi:hypothetical protein